MAPDCLLEAQGIAYHAGSAELLRSVGLRLAGGELLGLIGPNGAGKSTLVRVLAGLLRPSAGRVRLAGTPLNGLEPSARARLLGYLPQGAEVHWPLQVERLVGLGRLPHLAPWQSPGEGDRCVVERVMGETDCLHLRSRTFDTLSGGERARVLLARVLAVEPRVLLADEPAAALDPAHQVQVMGLLRGHCDRGGAAVVVLHDLALAAQFCHRLLLLHRGRVLAEGRPDEVLAGPAVAEAYGMRLKARSDGSVALPEFPWALADGCL